MCDPAEYHAFFRRWNFIWDIFIKITSFVDEFLFFVENNAKHWNLFFEFDEWNQYNIECISNRFHRSASNRNEAHAHVFNLENIHMEFRH